MSFHSGVEGKNTLMKQEVDRWPLTSFTTESLRKY